MYSPGVRVVRGQDWAWGDQDGGAGCAGTVCELGQPGKRSPDKTVVVCWDCGLRSNYRTGYQALFDLTVIDNAQCGVRHPNIECESCKQSGIVGMRYMCTICNDFDLCTLCYHADKHNLDHPFLRFDSPISSGVKLPARLSEPKLAVKGIFVGAIVQRGHDWKWGNQDGGEGSNGIVTDICNWGNESNRSVACVRWRDGSKNDYRVGHKGIMDLKFVTPAPGGSYYVNHLPILGKLPDGLLSNLSANSERANNVDSTVRLCPGDRVRVVLDADTLRQLQQGHGGWNPKMADYIGKIGVVHRITERGDIRVQHEGCPNRWTFHPAALVPVSWYRPGDVVSIISELAQVRHLQRQHGEWVTAMENALGKTGRVVNVYSDGDLRIQILEDSKRMWTFNPQCVTLVKRCSNPDQSPVAIANPMANPQIPNQAEVSPEVSSPGAAQGPSTCPDRPEMKLLMSKVAQGNLEYVKEFYENDKTIIETPYCGKTLLQVAAYQGHRPIVQFLLTKGAKPTAVDDDGDSVLHDAAFGNQPEILEILLSYEEVDINAVNRSRCTALHIAAHKCLPHCVWVLLQHNPNVNLQDAYGDTALHDAINNQCVSPPSQAAITPPLSSSMRIIQILCDHPDINFALVNKRGFNALQHAALKGNAFACAAICRRAPHLVDVPKEDGFSALHLAALNGHTQAVNALVTIGRADLNLRNNRNQTPLLLATSQGHCSVIEQLINMKCSATAVDEDGNSALHIAYMKRSNAQSSEAQKPTSTECPGINEIYQKLVPGDVGANGVTYSIIIFLIHKGCDPSIRNKEGKTIFDLMDTVTGCKKLQDILPNFPPPQTRQNSSSRESTHEQVERSTSQLGEMTLTPDESWVESPGSDSGPVEAAAPNSSRGKAFGGHCLGVNVYSSPSRRSNYNLLSNVDLGECSSSNSSPVHGVNRAIPGKPNNTSASPQHPVRPSRHKKTSSPPSGVNRTKPTECAVCSEYSEANCLLEPCGHRPACEDCAARMKKCLSCGVIIEKRLTTDGRVIQCRSRQPSAERLRYLEFKIQEIEEAHCCSICLERRKTVAFLCGHGACANCAATLSICHMCRQDITSKINLY